MYTYKFEYHADNEGFRIIRSDGKATEWLGLEASAPFEDSGIPYRAEDVWQSYWKERREEIADLLP